MTGFKSFLDKTVVEFDKGMTSVVGPNGSGKSNLTEAIRWVLGEQSAKSLRGNKMEDVIFNGTQLHKPVNIAKVTVVLNNEDRYLDYDFSEISISRSYNRNGDSHYYINNESVRLKDVVDLLLDSGLGKNSFSIISQGQVEQIFLNKAEERRGIFEEAAGVQKYQYRKNEAERKLNRSSDNLSRVKDIVHELESQLKSLKSQREKALIYLDKSKELESLEISLYTHQIQAYKSQWDQLEIELDANNQSLSKLIEQEELSSEEITKAKLIQNQLLEEIDILSDAYQELITHIEKIKGQKQIIEKDIQYQESSAEDKNKNRDEQIKEQEEVSQQLKQHKEEIERFKRLQAELTEEINALTEKLEITQGLDKEEYDELRNKMMDWYQEEAKTNNQKQQALQTINFQNKKVQQYDSQINKLKEEVKELEEELQTLDANLNEFSGKQNASREKLNDLLQQTDLMEKQRDILQNQLFNQERKKQNAQASLNSLLQMQEDYSGYYSGVRAVMKNADRISGIEGTVAELINVKEEFRQAIDTALGGSLQHIVVRDEQAARQAVQFLKQHQAGRATFLPRPNISPRYLANNILAKISQLDGFIGIASDLVEFREENRNIILNLLANTIVARSLKEAQYIARVANQRVKVVTLEGEVIMPGGALTGGKQRNQQQSMLARQQKLNDAQEQLKAETKHLTSMEKDWQALLANHQAIQSQLNSYREDNNQTERIYQSLFQEKQIASQSLKQKKNEMTIVNDDLKESQSTLNEARQELEIAQNKAQELSESILKSKELLEQHNIDEDVRAKQLKEIEGQLNEANTRLAVVEVQLKQEIIQRKAAEENLENLSEWLEQYDRLQVENIASLESLNQRHKEVSLEINRLTEKSKEQQSSIKNLRSERKELNDSIVQQEADHSKLQSQIQKTNQRISHLQAQIEKNQSLIDNYLNLLNQDYQLSFEKALEKAQTIEKPTEVNQRVKEIRKDIDKLGPINVQAIDDYNQLYERYELLTDQQNDLLEAMGQLQETMDKMDKEVIQRFGTTFKEINQQFNKTFKKLFGGGDAVLTLTNPNDLLTTGVDIVAQPPGKKKQNLGLLSGGERALTAIALLFAILEVKPVPFVILDEVEAALDDANVYRYGQYIKDFTEQTQFIVITHRKGTMESADRLYGVTMEKSGVSKLASVKLSEAKEY